MQNVIQTPERWFSTKEMCDYLGVSRDTLLTWINEKGMPAHKVGRGWKYKPSEVDAWIKSGQAAEYDKTKAIREKYNLKALARR